MKKKKEEEILFFFFKLLIYNSKVAKNATVSQALSRGGWKKIMQCSNASAFKFTNYLITSDSEFVKAAWKVVHVVL